MVDPTRRGKATVKPTVLLLACLAALAGTLLLGAGSASALEIRSFATVPSSTQAGGHPDVTINYSGEFRESPQLGKTCQCNDPKDIDISFPPGFIGNPHATPQCAAADYARNACPADSQIGTISPTVDAGGGLVLTLENEPLYNMIPRPNQAGLLAAALAPEFFTVPLYIELAARTGTDYGLDSKTDGIERLFNLQKFSVTLWGVPADDVHTPLRWSSLGPSGHLNTPSNSPPIPFLINPSTCRGPLTSSVRVVGYDNTTSSASTPWPTSTGCDQLTFNPSLSAKPTTTATDSASGVDIDLTVPQLLSPSFPSPSEIKGASVTLPVGFSLNPNAADGKTSCSDAVAKFGTTEAAGCPEFAKVGTDTIDSPALPAPVPGGIYIGEPLPGNRYRIFLTADGFGTHIKLSGTIRPDPETGQVVTSFDDLPQSPLTEFNLHFFGAERGLLATPTQCGTYPVKSTFTPWDEELASQSSTQFFVLDSGSEGVPCPPAPRAFNPSFAAASAGNTAGAHSPFTMDLSRTDGNQNLSGLTVTTPPGFSATLAGVPYCPESSLAAASSSYTGLGELASPICPAASQIGTSVAGAGAGTRPVYLEGKVYLAGPYRGAPLSLAVITPAVSGPYDLGNVVVRAALHVDPSDAHVTAVSDPLPRILDGIPLRLRTVRINLNRPDFTLNPTSCEPFSVNGSILGEEGTGAGVAPHFQVANCENLSFVPKLSLNLTGGVKRRGHPAIRAELTSAPGEANIQKIAVTLPSGELLDNSHIGTVCTRVDFANRSCPPGSLVGQATVDTPLLDQPLTGPAYLRTSQHQLPDLALDLHGQVDFEAAARIDSVRGRLRANFETVPDVPFSRIVLNLQGGSKGLLQNTETLCEGVKRAMTRMTAHSGATLEMKTKLQANCASSSKKKRRGRSR